MNLSTQTMNNAVSPGTISPATGTALTAVAANSPEDVVAIVEAARAAQVSWAALSLKVRVKQLEGFVHAVLSSHAEVLEIMSQETGRSQTECMMSEVVGLMDYLRAAHRAAIKALAPEKIKLSVLDYPGKSVVVEAIPRGVVGIIAPWNFPLSNFWKSLFPALLAGNAVVLKPSEHTPRTGAWLAEQCGLTLPEGLVGLVQGAGEVGAALLNAKIDSIVFTGSVRTGKRVAVAAAERLIPCSVELGGKDAAIVLADCDLERTIAGITQWGMMNAGQNCSGIERVYVETSIADQFVSRLGKAIAQLRVAPDEPCDLGPLQNQAQLEIVRTHVDDAKEKGATLVCGGEPTGQGYGFQPTLLDNCTPKMKLVHEETFGPVIAIIRVNDAQDALLQANDCLYGLNGSVWTTDLKKGEALARKLEVGIALVNNHSLTGIMAEVPWTGVKDTGTGVAGSRHAYESFVRRRTVFVDRSKKPDPWWLPVTPELHPLGQALIERNLGSKRALLKLAGLVGKRIKSIREFYRD
jgi:acyl-CoA reductase-like NAD-dependent aldehyde dehydrogenase